MYVHFYTSLGVIGVNIFFVYASRDIWNRYIVHPTSSQHLLNVLACRNPRIGIDGNILKLTQSLDEDRVRLSHNFQQRLSGSTPFVHRKELFSRAGE